MRGRSEFDNLGVPDLVQRVGPADVGLGCAVHEVGLEKSIGKLSPSYIYRFQHRTNSRQSEGTMPSVIETWDTRNGIHGVTQHLVLAGMLSTCL
jgi:hypothetical protein